MNPLQNIVPAKYRRLVYAVLSLALLVFTLYNAAEGDWMQFAGALLLALTTGTAASNTPTHPEQVVVPVPVEVAPEPPIAPPLDGA